ncbi:MAG TPA: hypothetical protein VLB80_00275 [Candidatus Babeliales bacterium]|nr:hypothetical protein [Candidatus Babeliales bacterium]
MNKFFTFSFFFITINSNFILSNDQPKTYSQILQEKYGISAQVADAIFNTIKQERNALSYEQQKDPQYTYERSKSIIYAAAIANIDREIDRLKGLGYEITKKTEIFMHENLHDCLLNAITNETSLNPFFDNINNTIHQSLQLSSSLSIDHPVPPAPSISKNLVPHYSNKSEIKKDLHKLLNKIKNQQFEQIENNVDLLFHDIMDNIPSNLEHPNAQRSVQKMLNEQNLQQELYKKQQK